MKGYKGFDKDLTCRGKQYEIGRTEHEEDAMLCQKGLHFCENPHDVFGYYSAGEGHRFCEVSAEDVSDERKTEDSKRVCKTLKVEAEISVLQICKIAVRAFFENFNFKEKIAAADANNAGDYGAANAGNYGAANAGDYGAANAGDYGAANAGDCGAANAGYKGAANAGNYGAANAGNCGAANAGDYGAANAGDYGAANAGDCGAANVGNYGAANAGNKGAANAGDYGAANAGAYGAANAGDCGAANAGAYGAANAGNCGAANAGYKGAASVGDNGVAVVSTKGRAKGGKGSILVLVNRDEYNEIVEFKAVQVDGAEVKADIWYRLEDGNLLEDEQS